jgi:hypothetical protein
MKNKTLQTLGIIGLAVTIAATTGLLLQQQQQLVYASIDPETGNNIDEEEESNTQEGEGGREWTTPNGDRCVETPAGVLSCDSMNGIMKGIIPSS